MTDKEIIRPNDTVFHRPSGETWVVCGVDNEKGELIPCGYPFPTLAKLSDCELTEAGNGKQPKEYAEALKKHGLDRFIEMNKPKLKSCPFCGGEAKIQYIKSCLEEETRVFVQCSCCKAQTAEVYVEQMTVEAGRIVGCERQPINSVEGVTEMWNRRADNDQ